MSKVVIFLADGFEEVEALTVVDYLRRADVEVNMVSIGESMEVEGSHRIKVFADSKLFDFSLEGYDGVVLPGGMPGTKYLYENEKVLQIVNAANEKGILVAAICAAPSVLYRAGILNGKKVTSYPSVKDDMKEVHYLEEKVVQDGNIITSRSAATAVDFALKLIEVLLSKEASDRVGKSILYR